MFNPVKGRDLESTGYAPLAEKLQRVDRPDFQQFVISGCGQMSISDVDGSTAHRTRI